MGLVLGELVLEGLVDSDLVLEELDSLDLAKVERQDRFVEVAHLLGMPQKQLVLELAQLILEMISIASP